MLALSMNIASYADEGILFHLVQESTLLCWHVVVSPQVGVERSRDESSHVITGAKLSVIGDNTPRLATAASDEWKWQHPATGSPPARHPQPGVTE